MSYSAPYDTELNLADGTSLLTLQLDQGMVGTLEIDGWVTAYVFNANGQIDSTRTLYCQGTYGVPNCPVPPKWMCPYISATWGAAATLAAIAATKVPNTGIIGGFVQAAVQQFCEALNADIQWSNLRYRTAAVYSSPRYS
jgi:hypothetical protein